MFTIAAFYHFFDFPDFKERRTPLLAFMKERDIKGSILVADEGFNGTVSGTRSAIDELLGYLEMLGGTFEHKESSSDAHTFKRTKVRLKKELISLGPKVAPDQPGIYVDPKDWNALIDDPDTLVIDTRNTYETHLGSFKGAIDPGTRNFKQLPHWTKEHLADAKKKRIATFCTGGIRCEKYTSWLHQQGFDNVYHLKGGILKYLEEIPATESRWEGECFVFDRRFAVGHGLQTSGKITMCYCGHPLTEEDRDHPSYIENRQCRHCVEGKAHGAP